jgi:magnesium chelatase accessory protein
MPARFIVGERDRAVPPASVSEAAALMPDTRVHSLPGLGHVAHEEAPELVAEIIAAALREIETQKAADIAAAHA